MAAFFWRSYSFFSQCPASHGHSHSMSEPPVATPEARRACSIPAERAAQCGTGRRRTLAGRALALHPLCRGHTVGRRSQSQSPGHPWWP